MDTTLSHARNQSPVDLSDLLDAPSNDNQAIADSLKMPVSFFGGLRQTQPVVEKLTLRELAARIPTEKRETKDALPMLKLAVMDGAKAADVRTLTGAMADYDAGAVTMDEAVARLERAGVAAIVYQSPSSRPESPRWRVLAPYSRPVGPEAHQALTDRLNGVLGGIIDDAASWKIHQRFYYGQARVRDKEKGGGAAAAVTPIITAGKTLIDDADHCLEGTVYKRPHGAEIKEASPAVEVELIDTATDAQKNWARLQLDKRTDALSSAVPGQRHQTVNDAALWAAGAAAQGGMIDRDTAESVLWAACEFNEMSRSKFDLAFNGGWKAGLQKPITNFPREVSADAFEDLEDDLLADFTDAPKPQPSILTFTTPDECSAVSSRRYVIKGMLAERDVACIVGAPGVGKSLLAPYLAYAVAQGREVFGSRIKSGGVMYVAAEDHHGMVGRIQALKEEYGSAGGFALVGGVSDLLSKDSAHLKELRQAANERRPSLIVIDTLAMAFPGLEENSAEGMGRVVAVARSLTKWGAAVVLVHHDTKDGQQGLPRGHSLLNGALDVALHLKRDEGGIIRGKLTKNRNGSCEKALAFTIGVQTIGEDEDGDPVTVAFCREANPAVSLYHEPKLNRPERVSLEVLCKIQPATREEWQAAAIVNDALCASDNRKSRLKAFERAVAGLADKGNIQRIGDLYQEYDAFDEMEPIASEHGDDGDRRRQPGDMSPMSPMRKRVGLATDSDISL